MNLQALFTGWQQTCVLCGQMVQFGGDNAFTALRRRRPRFDHVCNDCLRTVPWIVDIVCSVCGRPVDCPDCIRREDGAFVQNRSALRYDVHVPEWLALYKYQGHEAVGAILGEFVDMAYLHLMQERTRVYADFKIDALIPVPLSTRKLHERGFNQAEQLARCVAERRAIPLLDALVRVRHQMVRQSDRSRLERMASTEHLYAVGEEGVQMLCTMAEGLRRLSPNRPLRVCIVDDIYTTGSTANACAQALQQTMRTVIHSAVEVYVITLARA